MGFGEEIFLVRHGEYGTGGILTDGGREIQAPRARDELLGYGLGKSALLLSSSARRAAETAVIIGQGLGTEPYLSNAINEAGNSWAVRDLDAVVEEALDEIGATEYDPSQGLVVVTHAPMLAVARGLDSAEDIRFGEVFRYIRGTWDNPDAPKK